MAANPIFQATPNVSSVDIPNANAVVRNDGVSAATSNDNMYKAFTAGASGSFVEKIKVSLVATGAAKNATANVVRFFLSTVNSAPSATTAANTHLLGDIAITASTGGVASATVVTPQYELTINRAIPTGTYILACQHAAQGTDANVRVTVFGGDY